MENVQSNRASVKPGDKSAPNSKPGRKFGLTGQRQVSTIQTGNVNSSLSDGHRFSVREEPRNSWMYSLSEQEMEEKYNATCLAIRTENLTLRQRLEHTHAERDLVENNLSQEVKALHSLFVMLKQEVARSHQQTTSNGTYRDGLGSGAWNELFFKVANQLDAVHSSALRISSSAETLGAVEYEARLSAAVQVLILYVDHIKRKWEREHHELEETKRILKESGVNVAQCLATLPERQQQQQQQQQGSGPVSKRRASFPAAPLRRISLRTPPNRVLFLESVDFPISTTPIAEEREDGDDQPPKSPVKKNDVELKNKKPETNNNESNNENNNNNNNSELVQNGDSQRQTSPEVSVTIRRKGVAGYKSHSWSSGSGVVFNVFANRRQSEDSPKWTWTRAASQWSRTHLGRLRRQASVVRSTCREQWNVVRDRKLELLRYGASACLLLAALFSLLVTFIPSKSSVSLPPNFNASNQR